MLCPFDFLFFRLFLLIYSLRNKKSFIVVHFLSLKDFLCVNLISCKSYSSIVLSLEGSFRMVKCHILFKVGFCSFWNIWKVTLFLFSLLTLQSSKSSILIELPMRRGFNWYDDLWEHWFWERLWLNIVFAELLIFFEVLNHYIVWIFIMRFKQILKISSLRNSEFGCRR